MSTTSMLIQMAKVALEGKTVLVTGGAGGIGSEISSLFYQAGVNVIVTGSNQKKLDDFAVTLKGSSAKVFAYQCDLRSRKEVQELVQKTLKECPPIDFLINNAGFALESVAPFWEQDLEVVGSVMDVNLTGLMTLTHEVLKNDMMQRRPQPTGTIINVSSITGHMAPSKEAFEASYHTSKAAVEGFTNVLRNELCGTNIRVLLNRPGTVRTEFHSRRHMYDQSKVDAGYGGIAPLIAEDIAVGVLWQCLQPERVAVVLMEVWPSSQRSLYVNDREWEQRNPEDKV